MSKDRKDNLVSREFHNGSVMKFFYEKPSIGVVKLLADQVLGNTSGCLKVAAEPLCGSTIENV